MPSPALPNINLGLLRTFAVMSETRSVTMAARRLDLTQSAVSHAIGRLRELFGDPLFIRKRSGFMLTPRAVDLVGPVRDLLHSADQLFPPSAFDQSDPGRSFRVAFSEPCMLAFGPAIQATLNRFPPMVALELNTATAEMERQVREGLCDVALWHSRAPPPGLHHRRLHDDVLVGLVHGGHPLAPELRRRPITPDEYGQHAAPYRSSPRDRLSEGQANSLILDLLTLANRTSVATFPRKVVESSQALCGELVAFDLPTRVSRLTYWMFWNDRSDRDPGCTWLRRTIEEAVSTTLLPPRRTRGKT